MQVQGPGLLVLALASLQVKQLLLVPRLQLVQSVLHPVQAKGETELA